jgi:glyoxylase-like metal-dependent hydrolase (beta-lactamase superfamily II)
MKRASLPVLHCQSTAVPSSTSIKPADLLVARVTPSPDDGPDRGREQITRYKDRTRLFQKGDVFPGVTAIPCPGHTPGHTSFLISSGNEQVLIWGDTVHVPEIQTARPEVCMEFDTDPDAAAVTRRRVFDRVATDRLPITGVHLHFPGFAHLMRRGPGYQLVPEAWEQTL